MKHRLSLCPYIIRITKVSEPHKDRCELRGMEGLERGHTLLLRRETVATKTHMGNMFSAPKSLQKARP